MKYKVGDRTVLGEIESIQDEVDSPYFLSTESDVVWLTEAEIDKIIIKPKRNIDHLAELWDGGKINEAVAFFNHVILESKIAVIENVFAPYAEPSKYPKLTPDELKAVKWLVDGGFTHLDNICAINDFGFSQIRTTFKFLPIIGNTLSACKWLTSEPINLKELLDAQEADK